MVSHHSKQIAVQTLPSVVIVDERLLSQQLKHNFVMIEEDRGIHYSSLNQGQGNQKGLGLLFAMVLNYDQTLESRWRCRDLSMMDGKYLGFVRMEEDLLRTGLAL